MNRLTRGSGHRKIGGLYLVGRGRAVGCDRLPLEVSQCAACGHGIKRTRGYQWVRQEAFPLLPYEGCGRVTCDVCPVGFNAEKRFGFMWIGKERYPTPESFVDEAQTYGVSKRIAQVPRGLVLGSTFIMLAHPEASTVLCGEGEARACTCATIDPFVHMETRPGVVFVFRVERVEVPVPRVDAEAGLIKHTLDDLRKRKLTPVLVDTDEHGDAIEYGGIQQYEGRPTP